MRSIRLSLGLALGLIVSLVGAGATFAADPTIIDWPGSEANQASYWESYFADRGYDYDCTKVDEAGAFTTTEDHDAIVVKNDQRNFIWQPAPAGEYTTDKGVSHWFYCDGPDSEVVAPNAAFGGPCYDPAHYAIFDNLASDVALTFRMRFGSVTKVTKVVPAGQIFRSRLFWARGGTILRIGYLNPETDRWVNLATKVAESGNYPRCPYVRGFSTDPIGTYEPDTRSQSN